MLDIALQMQTPLVKRQGSVRGVPAVRKVERLEGELTSAVVEGRSPVGAAALSPYSNLLKYAGNVDFIKDRSSLLDSGNIKELVKLRNYLGDDEEVQKSFGNALISLATKNPSTLTSFLDDTNRLVESSDREQALDYFNYVISVNVRPLGAEEAESSEDFTGNQQQGDHIPNAVTIGSEDEDFNTAIQQVLQERLDKVKAKVGNLDFAEKGATMREFLGQGVNLINAAEPSSYVVFSLLS